MIYSGIVEKENRELRGASVVKYFTSKLTHGSLDPINQENAQPEQSTQPAIPEQRESDKRSWKKLAREFWIQLRDPPQLG